MWIAHFARNAIARPRERNEDHAISGLWEQWGVFGKFAIAIDQPGSDTRARNDEPFPIGRPHWVGRASLAVRDLFRAAAVRVDRPSLIRSGPIRVKGNLLAV